MNNDNGMGTDIIRVQWLASTRMTMFCVLKV